MGTCHSACSTVDAVQETGEVKRQGRYKQQSNKSIEIQQPTQYGVSAEKDFKSLNDDTVVSQAIIDDKTIPDAEELSDNTKTPPPPLAAPPRNAARDGKSEVVVSKMTPENCGRDQAAFFIELSPKINRNLSEDRPISTFASRREKRELHRLYRKEQRQRLQWEEALERAKKAGFPQRLAPAS